MEIPASTPITKIPPNTHTTITRIPAPTDTGAGPAPAICSGAKVLRVTSVPAMMS